ncbi:MAG TPA: hypothetical protein VLA74_11295 [Nitrososphaeraceae archaeon]|nr:hypothetical protein [Nitrososphaeraceae archaeon]
MSDLYIRIFVFIDSNFLCNPNIRDLNKSIEFNNIMEIVTTISISLPRTIVEEIDNHRGDINRSKCILRLIESKFHE